MPLPSWRTGRMRRLLTAVSRQLVLPVAALCLSRHRESNPMPAGPVAVRYGERSAQGVCFFLPRSCRGAHFIGPWLVVDVRFDVWFETRGDAREPRGVGRFVGVLGGVSRPEFGGLVLRGSSVVGRRFAAKSGRPPVIVATAKGSRSV